MKNSEIYYSVGPLLYCPANHLGVAGSLLRNRFGEGYSLTFCLEDTIRDDGVAEAEEKLCETLHQLYRAKQEQKFFLPKIFVRVRSAAQMYRLYGQFGETAELVWGFNAPKFTPENAGAYIEKLEEINGHSKRKVYLMPIMESGDMIDLNGRSEFLGKVKEQLSAVEELVLNVRVGGNDLCHCFGFRRAVDETIHDIRPVANLFADIVATFGREYVISGPVWEYYSGDGWQEGMRRELKLDKLMGFAGKTVIHPNQIPLVNEAYRVNRKDYEDAQNILSWDPSNPTLVSGSVERDRMNEYKTHKNWAEKTLYMGKAYGIRG